jgi:hypothetical protein
MAQAIRPPIVRVAAAATAGRLHAQRSRSALVSEAKVKGGWAMECCSGPRLGRTRDAGFRGRGCPNGEGALISATRVVGLRSRLGL